MARPYTPRPWHPAMIEHACEHARANQWAGVGTGKTGSTLFSVDLMHLTGELTQPALVLAPLRVARDTWSDEARKWDFSSAWDVETVVGDARAREAALARLLRGNAPLATINYDNIPWLMEKLDGKWPFGMVIADESTRLKSFRGGWRTHPKSGKRFFQASGGQRAKAIARFAHATPRWINLTGTPSPNGLIDLWGPQWMIDGGGRLGRTFEAFKERWFQRSFDGHSLDPLPFAQDQIEKALHDVSLTTEVPTKEPFVNLIYVDMPGRARDHYREMERKMFTALKSVGIEAVNAAARSSKCLQIANGAVYDNEEDKVWHEVHNAKIEALESLIEESAGAPVLVAYQWKHDLARLQKAFPSALNLSTVDGLRRAKKGEGRVWLAHPASLGHGVDGLQEHCHILAFFGLWWDLELHDQVIGRIGPMRQLQAGKDRAVYIHYILAAGTLDEDVLDRLTSKRSVQQILLDAMKRKAP